MKVCARGRLGSALGLFWMGGLGVVVSGGAEL